MRSALEKLIGAIVFGALVACGAFTSADSADDTTATEELPDGSVSPSDANTTTVDGGSPVGPCDVPSDFCDDFEAAELKNWTPRGAFGRQTGEVPGTRALRFRLEDGGAEKSTFIEQTRSWPESNRIEVELRVRINVAGKPYIKGPSNVVVAGEGFGISNYQRKFSCDGAGADDLDLPQVLVDSWQTLRYEVARTGDAVRLRCQVDGSPPTATDAPPNSESATYTLRVGVAHAEGATSLDVDWIRVRALPSDPTLSR